MLLPNVSTSLVFIDPSVEDYQSLVNGALPQTEVIVLDRDRSGVEQISEILAGRSGIGSIHIVSHGASGSLQLGNAPLGLDNLDSYTSFLQQWQSALTDDGDILLYGCDVGSDRNSLQQSDRNSPVVQQSRRGLKPTANSPSWLKPTEKPILQSSEEDLRYETGVLTPGGGTGEATGIDFIEHLAQLTGADIAASTDKTGSAAVGGDWELEATTGEIEAPLAFQPEVMATYNNLLPLNFAPATNFGVGTAPYSVAVGNFNADSIADLATVNYWDNNVSILLGDGAGGFGAASNFGVGTAPYSVAVGDFNADSIADLAATNYNDNNVSILLGNGTGGFGAATNFGVGTSPYSVAVGDFNADSISDLAVTNFYSNDVSILLANGTGGFGAATNFGVGMRPYKAAVGDFNADSIADLAVTNYNDNNVSILLGDGTGGFGAATNFGVGTGPFFVAVGNFNADSILDLAVTNYNDNNVSILLGNGTGGFGAATNFGVGTGPYYVAVGDFNADSIPDLATANYNSSDVSILLGNGTGGFSAATNFGAGANPFSVTVGDFNGDVKPDLAVANNGSNNVSILLNNTTAPVANADTAAITVGTPKIKIDVLGNDTDANSDYLSVQGIATAPTNGTAAIDDWIYVGGDFTTVNGTSRNYIARLNSDGSLDTSFNPGSGMDNNVDAIALQPDGKPVVGGYFTTVNGTSRNSIARLNSDGSLDTSFDPGSGMNSGIQAIALQPDGKPIIGGGFTTVNGTSRNNIARLNGDGSLDAGFDPGTGTNSSVRAIALQSDGKPVVGGAFTTVNGTSRNNIARLNSDGSLDTSFNPGSGMDNNVNAIALQSDDKPVVGGGFTTVNGTSRNYIARLNGDGSLDTSFDPGAGMDNVVNAIALQSDDKPVVGGGFTTVNGTSRNYIARLNGDGSLDASFDPGAGMNSTVSAIALQSDGKPVVGGWFTTVNGTSRNYIARLNSDGSLDTSFDPGTGMNNIVSAIAIDPGRSITYTPNPGFNGVDTFSYTLTDGSDTATATATILVNDSPVLDNSGNSFLTNTEFNDINNGGTLITDIIARGAGGNPITDINAGATEGIAIIAADTTNGSWQYTIDGGTTWNYFPAVSANNALLLADDVNTRIRFIPNNNYLGDASLTFHAWDRITGTNGSTADVAADISINGNSSAFSSATETASVTVNPIISIGGVTVTEGNAGTLNGVFTVSLNGASSQVVSVDYATADNTATAGSDYIATTGTLTFSPGQTSQTVAVTVNGDDVAELDENFFVNLSNPTNSTIADTQAFGTITDDDTVGFSVTPISGDTSEIGGSASFSVALTSQPTADVIIAVNSSNPAEGNVSPSTLTFTSANWNQPQVVTVTGVDDAVADGNIAYTIVTASALSNDANYNNLDLDDVAVTNTDNDSPAVLINQTDGSTDITEGSTGDTYTVAIATAPTTDVIVIITPDAQINLGAGAGVPINFTFTSANWNAAQTVNVIAIDDPLAQGDRPSTITHTIASGSAAEYLPVTIGNVITNITDNDSPGVSITQAGGSTDIAEGGTTDIYTVVLTTAPTSDVIVTITPDAQIDLGGGAGVPVNLTFTSDNWEAPQTLNIAAVDDALAEGNQSSIITHAIAAGSATEYLPVTINNITANIADNDSPGVSITQSGGSNDITEGGTDSYTVVLTTAPTADVIITVTPDAQTDLGAGTGVAVNFVFTPTNWNAAQTVIIGATDDVVAEGNHSSTITHAVAAGSATEYLPVTINNVTANITDNDSPGVSIAQSGGSIDVTEGGNSDTYTVELTTAPTDNVTITVTPDTQTDLGAGAGNSVNLLFTANNWNATQTVNVVATDDTLAEGNHNSTITHAVATSSAVEYLPVTIGNITANIVDNDLPGVSINSSGGNTEITEGGNADTYTVVLTTAPTAPVTINFTTDGQINAIAPITFDITNWNVAQTIAIRAFDDAIAEGIHVSTINHNVRSADANYNGMALTSITTTIVDNDSAGISIAPTSTNITEGGATGNYTVVLTTPPTSPVIINFTTDGQINAISPITFDNNNWNIPQTVTLQAVDDDLAQGNGFASAKGLRSTTITHAVESADAFYNGIEIASVTTDITDDDSPGVSITPTSTTTTEGIATGSYNVVLMTAPTAPVMINFTTDSQIQAIPPIAFDNTNWNIPRTITVATVDDVLAQGDRNSTITHTVESADADYNDINISDVLISITDNDTPGVSIAPTSINATESGKEGSYTVVLTTLPEAPVKINFKTDKQIGAIAPITFDNTNWNIAQTVTVNAVDDPFSEGSHSSTISHIAESADADYNGIGINGVLTAITDNDPAGIAIAKPVGSIDLLEGFEEDIYKVVLTNQPTADVRIAIATDGQTTTDLQSLTFTPENWYLSQTVTVQAVEDAANEKTHTSTISHTATSENKEYNNLAIAPLTINISDNDNLGMVMNLSNKSSVATGDRDDRVIASSENDIVHGRDGNDYLNSEAGDDIVYGAGGNDGIVGGDGNDQLYGGPENDYLNGNADDDLIYASVGNDRLRGGRGNDLLLGEEGNDHIFGDRGADIIVGGLGNDAFSLGVGMGGLNLSAADVITDFTLNEDVIDLIDSLNFNRLTIFQGTGANAKDTIVQDSVTSEYLAILQGITASSLNLGNFV